MVYTVARPNHKTDIEKDGLECSNVRPSTSHQKLRMDAGFHESVVRSLRKVSGGNQLVSTVASLHDTQLKAAAPIVTGGCRNPNVTTWEPGLQNRAPMERARLACVF